MKTDGVENAQSYELLSKIGKKVLRPGGREMTVQMLEDLSINSNDSIVEFAPGSGFSAKLLLNKDFLHYYGVERDAERISELQASFLNQSMEFICGDAENTHLPSESVDKVFGEAMLSMHANQRKERIIKEASRVLKKEGLYAIQELELSVENNDQEHEIQKELAIVSRVNARPQTIEEWSNLLESAGFKIIDVKRRPLRILEPLRIIEDEGFVQTFRIMFNVLKSKKIRKRVLEMRRTFKKYDSYLNAVVIIAKKV
jgi:ubiquinone/menaquinone biosynthesis C-methylase UbiE